MRGTLTEGDCSLIGAPSVVQPFCMVCGAPGVEQHHVVPRSRTVRRKDRGPTVSLCKGCHTHHHSVSPMRFVYDEGWFCNGRRCVTDYIEGA